MLSLGRLRLVWNPSRISRLLDQTSPMILSSLIAVALYQGYRLIQLSDGGSDLVNADIPKSLMLLKGQNPYSVEPWASPYPPLLLITVSAIIRLTGLLGIQQSLDLLSQNIRITGLIANSTVAITIYLYLRHRTGNGLQALLPAALFLTLPALSTSPLYFFHSDTFGYPILAVSLVALATNRYLIGTSLLATAAIFKIHPLLAVPLVVIWLLRRKGLRPAIPSLISTTAILTLGLFLPLMIPGYLNAVIAFNLSNTGNGTTIFSTLTIANPILPASLRITPTEFLANQVWIASTLALYTIIIGIVWTRAKSLGPVDIVLLGLLAWLIPLRIVFTHYIAWAMIPLLMRGQIKQTILVLGLLQLADTMAYWSWWPMNSPIPGLDTFLGLLFTSAVYRTLGLAALAFVLATLRNRNRERPMVDGSLVQSRQ